MFGFFFIIIMVQNFENGWYREPVSTDMDVNSINHLFLWVIFGMLIPNKWFLAILVMILWEIWEYIIVYNPTLYYLVKTYWPIPEKYWNENVMNKITDIGMNTLGYVIGSKLNSLILCKKDKNKKKKINYISNQSLIPPE